MRNFGNYLQLEAIPRSRDKILCYVRGREVKIGAIMQCSCNKVGGSPWFRYFSSSCVCSCTYSIYSQGRFAYNIFFAKYTVHSFSPKVKIRIAVFLWDGVTISYGGGTDLLFPPSFSTLISGRARSGFIPQIFGCCQKRVESKNERHIFLGSQNVRNILLGTHVSRTKNLMPLRQKKNKSPTASCDFFRDKDFFALFYSFAKCCRFFRGAAGGG